MSTFYRHPALWLLAVLSGCNSHSFSGNSGLKTDRTMLNAKDTDAASSGPWGGLNISVDDAVAGAQSKLGVTAVARCGDGDVANFAKAHPDMDFFKVSTDAVKHGPRLVFSAWTSAASGGVQDTVPTAANLVPLAYTAEDFPLAAATGQNQATPAALSTEAPSTAIAAPQIQPNAGLTQLAYPGHAASAPLAAVLGRGLSDMTQTMSHKARSEPYHLFIGAMLCSNFQGFSPDSASYPANDLVMKFLAVDVLQGVQGLNLDLLKSLTQFSAKLDYAAADTGPSRIHLSFDPSSAQPTQRDFTGHKLVALASNLLAATSLGDWQKAHPDDGALLKNWQDQWSNGASCASLGGALGSEQSTWYSEHSRDVLKLELPCTLLFGGVSDGSLAAIASGKDQDFATQKTVLATRLLRTALYNDLAALVPSSWQTPQISCLPAAPAAPYINTVLQSVVLPLKLSADGHLTIATNFTVNAQPSTYSGLASGLMVGAPVMATSGAAALSPAATPSASGGDATGSSLATFLSSSAVASTFTAARTDIVSLHPESSFVGVQSRLYLDPTSGNLQTIFGMWDYAAMLVPPVTLASDPTSLAALIDPANALPEVDGGSLVPADTVIEMPARSADDALCTQLTGGRSFCFQRAKRINKHLY